MSEAYLPVARNYKYCYWVQRPNSKRVVNPVNECNRLLDRTAELEAALKRMEQYYSQGINYEYFKAQPENQHE